MCNYKCIFLLWAGCKMSPDISAACDSTANTKPTKSDHKPLTLRLKTDSKDFSFVINLSSGVWQLDKTTKPNELWINLFCYCLIEEKNDVKSNADPKFLKLVMWSMYRIHFFIKFLHGLKCTWDSITHQTSWIQFLPAENLILNIQFL